MNAKGLALVTATAVISGISIFLNKYAVSGMDSSVFTFSKNALVAFSLAALILAALAARKRLSLPHGMEWLWLAAIGLVGGAVPFLLFFRGLQLTPAATASFLHKTMFLYVALLAALFLRERVRKSFFIAGAALLAGSFLLLKVTRIGAGYGEMLILSAALLWAAENVMSKHVLKRLDGTVVAAGRMGFGAIFLFLFLLGTGKAGLVGELSQEQSLWVLFTSLLLLGYVLTWYNGLKHMEVSVATTVLLLGSPITTLLSAAFSSAPLTLSEAAGMVLITGGVAAALWSGRLLDAIRARRAARG